MFFCQYFTNVICTPQGNEWDGGVIAEGFAKVCCQVPIDAIHILALKALIEHQACNAANTAKVSSLAFAGTVNQECCCLAWLTEPVVRCTERRLLEAGEGHADSCLQGLVCVLLVSSNNLLPFLWLRGYQNIYDGRSIASSKA